MNEITSLRDQGLVSGVFIDKAQTLLTQSWSGATWRSREQILRTVDWLLQMELAHPSKRADRSSGDPGPADAHSHSAVTGESGARH